MPTTSNFGWTTPADTDLVKDGAAAIRTLGNGIDTSLVDLKGGTTGQVLSKASNTDLDFSWVAQDDSNAIQNALLTTTGDTIYASGASTPARLGIGTTGQVLTVSGGVPTWATPSSGGMTLISTTTLSGATVTLSSIPQTYVNLYAVIRNYKPATDDSRVFLRVNGDSGGNRYQVLSSNVIDPSTFGSSEWDFAVGNDNSVANGIIIFTLDDYTNSVTWKSIFGQVWTTDNTTTTSFNWMRLAGIYNQTAAITSLVFSTNSGNFTSGTLLLYGVK